MLRIEQAKVWLLKYWETKMSNICLINKGALSQLGHYYFLLNYLSSSLVYKHGGRNTKRAHIKQCVEQNGQISR